MRVRYFIEYALEQDPSDGHHFYRPIGVWARGEGPWEMTLLYLPDAEERQWAADLHTCDFMERGDTHFPDDLLEGWIGSVSLYTGDCSPIYETEAKGSEEVATQILATLISGNSLPTPAFLNA
jgi:hypothetical protein